MKANMQKQQQETMFHSPCTAVLEAMRKQELAYICHDYLHQDSPNRRHRLALPQTAINVACRTSMFQWMQTVISFIGFDPETAEISMSYLDRFLETQAGQEAINCRTIYQLAAMTTLYTAVKINCSEALTPKLLAELSQGAYEAEQFEEMERIICSALQWRVNPPTSASFVRETMDLLPQSIFQTEEIRQSVLDTARVQAEWAVGDYDDLLSVKKSVIAFAALNNSLRSNRVRFNLSKYLNQVVQGHNIDLDIKQATMIQKTLREALPPRPDEEELMDTSMLSATSDCVADNDIADDSSVKTFNSYENRSSPPKRLSAGKSPRSVLCSNAPVA